MKLNCLIAAALAVAAGACQAHVQLDSSEPKAASVLDSAPKALRLKFNEAVEPAFSKIALRNAANRDIALPKPAIVKADQMAVPLPALPAGEYRVQWSAVSHDGHRSRGEFAFRVR